MKINHHKEVYSQTRNVDNLSKDFNLAYYY